MKKFHSVLEISAFLVIHAVYIFNFGTFDIRCKQRNTFSRSISQIYARSRTSLTTRWVGNPTWRNSAIRYRRSSKRSRPRRIRTNDGLPSRIRLILTCHCSRRNMRTRWSINCVSIEFFEYRKQCKLKLTKKNLHAVANKNMNKYIFF